MSLKNESSNVFVSFGRVNLQIFFRNFTFEIIDHFKCHSNGSSLPQLNRMLESSLNCPTTTHGSGQKRKIYAFYHEADALIQH